MDPKIEEELRLALETAERDELAPEDRIEMLLQMAVGFLTKPKSAAQLEAAVELFDRAAKACAGVDPVTRARALAGKANALQMLPTESVDPLYDARDLYEDALVELRKSGEREEVADIELKLGLVVQALAGVGRAKMADAIAAYQRSLAVFDAKGDPAAYAILHNNLAAAYLSMPMAPEKEGLREGLAVRSFEQALEVVTLIDQPSEYAMLQNNLGNALQSMRSSHVVENLQRAVAAYDEALKVRNPGNTPLEYANTISNKANALLGLPDDLDVPSKGCRENFEQALALFGEAQGIFAEAGLAEQAEMVASTMSVVEKELAAMAS
ncbi:MAG: hypothetical protein AAF654_00045 [Myxococcota bacterium]